MSIRYRSGSKPALFFWWCSSALSPAAFFGRDSARNRPARSVHPGACNGTHPLLFGSGNRSDRAGGGKLGTGKKVGIRKAKVGSAGRNADRGMRNIRSEIIWNRDGV